MGQGCGLGCPPVLENRAGMPLSGMPQTSLVGNMLKWARAPGHVHLSPRHVNPGWGWPPAQGT